MATSLTPTQLPAVVPQTMTNHGLQFLEALARQNNDGCFLEVGPLFGSSTLAISRGRKTDETIYSIDTFAPAEWVQDRFGFNLSREAYDKYTSEIPRLKVIQGFAPDVVIDSWKEKIGFYFDDATHGNPGWMNNYSFFKQHFTPGVIICGDDYASGWPDIVANVNQLCNEIGARRFVVGRVFAFAYQDENRIISAVDELFPNLRGVEIETTHESATRTAERMPAAVWSEGLHLRIPLLSFRILGRMPGKAHITITRSDNSGSQLKLDQYSLLDETVDLRGAAQVALDFPDGLGVQFCVYDVSKRKCTNTKIHQRREKLRLNPGDYIVAVRIHSL